ncbi:hypothetical protein [Mammaliicoccus sciuri]|uniref:hypothetical protein n=1 Tax=Mammaliicoccus sciuri TaxID=1296 RepID=UPI001E5A974F|nr:hypothetical protein [Mammaliicoccus sciuri]MCD5142309.1 hypothetical protein [Mammaliicoccus sciuri]
MFDINFKIVFFIVTSIILIFLTILVGIGNINSIPKPIVIIGTITIFVMNVMQPLIEYIYSKVKNNKKRDVKANSFVISLSISIITAIVSYLILNDINWFEKIMNNGFVWGVNTAILLLNIAILEIENNNLKMEEMYYIREKEKIDRIRDQKRIMKLEKELILRDQKGENNERKNKHRD